MVGAESGTYTYAALTLHALAVYVDLKGFTKEREMKESSGGADLYLNLLLTLITRRCVPFRILLHKRVLM